MTCPICQDRGIVKVNWEDAPEDYAICICAAGLSLRVDRNYTHDVAPRWHLWCAREGIAIDRVFMLEDILTADELSQRGIPSREIASSDTLEAVLLRAGNTHKPRL